MINIDRNEINELVWIVNTGNREYKDNGNNTYILNNYDAAHGFKH